MWRKALWLRNWKNSKYIIYALWITLFITMPANYLEALSDSYNFEKRNGTFQYQHYFTIEFSTVIITGLLLVLAIALTTMEYRNKNIDFHLSLPFSRKDIFFSKFVYGAIHIVAALGINVLLTVIIIQTTVIHQYETNAYEQWGMFFLLASASFVAIYALSLFIGTITGHKVAHFTLTGILLLFVHGCIMLVERIVYAHTGNYEHVTFYQIHDAIKSFTLPIMLAEYRISYSPTFYNDSKYVPESFDVTMPTSYLFLSSAVIIAICLYFGQLAYTRTKSEHSGRLLLFPSLNQPFIICTSLCFALVGGFYDAKAGYLIINYLLFTVFGLATYFLLQWFFRKKQVA
jgi:acetoin utilization transport system permease protein